MITRTQAWDLLTSKMQNQNLRRHCLSVEAVMKALAQHFAASTEKWGIVGLLHDGDYEISKDNPSQHTLLMHDWLKALGETDEEILSAILSHNFSHLTTEALAKEVAAHPPNNNLEWSLYCCDELTGFIVAVTLVQPTKKLSDVTVENILKKWPQKAFAAGVNRDQVAMCEEKLGIKLEDFISLALKAMQSISPEIGL